jgi:hypothetical protein
MWLRLDRASLHGQYRVHGHQSVSLRIHYETSDIVLTQILRRNQNYVGTNSQGIWACFRNCATRVGCVAFMYTGTQNAAVNSGAGRC